MKRCGDHLDLEVPVSRYQEQDIVQLIHQWCPAVTVVRWLNFDLYLVFEGLINGETKCIGKIYFEYSDDDHTWKLLSYLEAQGYTKAPRLYSVFTLDQDTEEDWLYYSDEGTVHQINGVYRMILYEYLEGTPVQQLNPESINVWQLATEINTEMNDLHALGLIYAEIRLANIILTPEGHYRLIDYSRVIGDGILSTVFPPLEYMTAEPDDIPTYESSRIDFSTLLIQRLPPVI